MKKMIWMGRATLIPETSREIGVGMGIFNNEYMRTGNLPQWMMLFPLKGKYSNFTMEGVSFPLEVTFYTSNWRVIDKFTATAGMRDRPIPPDTWWMYEVPIHNK